MDIPEIEQAEALREVAALGVQRANALAEAERIGAELRAAAVRAAELGAPRTRIKELAHVSPSTLYAWFDAAGLEVRAKRPAAKKKAA
ncbi:hypothetical protein ACGFY6_33415 [Streptomyces sp. NPDC048387]|uniref:hypothetical protein n=1 Tax=Streptomyces sp. NPDC048387 TaxID=3365542 RepID=UPI0037147D1D